MHKQAKIQSISISKDQTLLRSLIITYKIDNSNSQEKTYIKLFRQESLGEFVDSSLYSESSSLYSNINNIEMHGNT